jgi:hypothetical protein
MKHSSASSIMLVLYTVFCLTILYGWVANIYKLCVADFEPSYKEEIVRSIGIVIAPVGVIAGFIDFDSEVKGDVK